MGTYEIHVPGCAYLFPRFGNFLNKSFLPFHSLFSFWDSHNTNSCFMVPYNSNRLSLHFYILLSFSYDWIISYDVSSSSHIISSTSLILIFYCIFPSFTVFSVPEFLFGSYYNSISLLNFSFFFSGFVELSKCDLLKFIKLS